MALFPCYQQAECNDGDRETSLLTGQELADDGCLARFLQQEAVVTVRRLDHVELGRLAQRPERLFDLFRRGRRVQPV